MIKDKVKALFSLYNVSQTELASKKGVCPQQLNKTINRANLRAKDLIEFANYTGTTLAFVDSEGKVVVAFDKNDIE